MQIILAYAIALAVPAFTLYLFFVLDVFNTRAWHVLLLCAAWGGSGAFLGAWGFHEALLAAGVDIDTIRRYVAPVSEETLKLLILAFLVRQPQFRYAVDGAIYGIAVGVGFGLSENLFIYLPGAGDAVLGIAISRALSAALMHATASGLVGIFLGRSQRSRAGRGRWAVVGVMLAIAVHAGFNALATSLQGGALLLVAVGFGLGGGVIVALQIGQSLSEEKRRFAETLGLNLGVSTGERQAIQRLGGVGIERVFEELEAFFGDEHLSQLRRLLVLQANVGILQHNLQSSASERLRHAWEQEIAEYQAEIGALRKQLGRVVELFLDRVFPPGDVTLQTALEGEIAQYDPTLVHTFDMFMRVSELAATFSPQQLTAMAERLGRIEIFRSVSLANLENLSRAIQVESYADGEVLFRQGDPGTAMMLVEQGTLAIYVERRADPLRVFGAGDVVGELALLDGRARSATARAQGSLTVLVLQREALVRFIQSRPQVMLAMLRYLTGKVRYTTQVVERVAASGVSFATPTFTSYARDGAPASIAHWMAQEPTSDLTTTPSPEPVAAGVLKSLETLGAAFRQPAADLVAADATAAPAGTSVPGSTASQLPDLTAHSGPLASVLRAVPMFQGLEDADYAALAASAVQRRLRAGETLFERDTPGDSMMIIAGGLIHIVGQDERGQPVLLRELQPGQTFGELSMLDALPRSAGAAATCPTEVIILPRETFLGVLAHRPLIGLGMLRDLVERVRFTTSLLQEVADAVGQDAGLPGAVDSDADHRRAPQ